MNPMHCMICNDINQFQLKVNDAKRILRNIQNILHKYGNIYTLEKYREQNLNFSFDVQNTHFMCGTCYKANTQSLRNIEKEIDECLLKFCKIIVENNANDTDYHNILRNLSGYYSGKYKVLERFWKEQMSLQH